MGLQPSEFAESFKGLVARAEAGAFLLDLGGSEEALTRVSFQERGGEVASFCVIRPVDDLRLFEALLHVMSHEGVVLYAPGSPPVVGHPATAGHLPKEMTEALGAAVVTSSAGAAREALFGG